MWHAIWQWALQNPGQAIPLFVTVAVGITNGGQFIASVMVGALDAPTAQSTAQYKYWFKVANQIVGNWKRANSTSLESSPNFEAAVNAAIQKIAESKGKTSPAVILDTNAGKQENPPH